MVQTGPDAWAGVLDTYRGELVRAAGSRLGAGGAPTPRTWCTTWSSGCCSAARPRRASFASHEIGYLLDRSMEGGPMEQSVRDVMTGSAIAVTGDASLADVGRLKRDHDVGAGGLARRSRSA